MDIKRHCIFYKIIYTIYKKQRKKGVLYIMKKGKIFILIALCFTFMTLECDSNGSYGIVALEHMELDYITN